MARESGGPGHNNRQPQLVPVRDQPETHVGLFYPPKKFVSRALSLVHVMTWIPDADAMLTALAGAATPALGETIEVSPDSMDIAHKIGSKINKNRGGALIIDYGENRASQSSIRVRDSFAAVPLSPAGRPF